MIGIRSLLITVLLTCLSIQSGVAQSRQGEVLQGTFKLKQVSGGVLLVESSDGKAWYLKPDRQAELRYVGSAYPNWLQRGMVVRFQSRFDEKLQALDAVDQLEVFTPGKDTKPGLIPKVSLAAGNNFFRSDDAKTPVQQGKRYEVVGRLAGLKSGNLSVSVGRGTVRAPLDDKLRISVNVANLSLARPDDDVEVEAWYIPGQEGKAIARRLTITSKIPLGKPPADQTGGKQADSKQASDGRNTPDDERCSSDDFAP